MLRGPPGRREDGVSVIVGTLLLILITVTAATALAMMVSEMQKENMIRQSHQTDVQNEALKIQSIELINDSNEWDSWWALVNGSSPGNTSPPGPGNWSTLEFTVVNLNTKDSQVVGVGVQPGESGTILYATNYSSGGIFYNLSSYLTIPAAQSQVINVSLVNNFSFSQPSVPLYIYQNQPVTIRIITSLQNVFDVTLWPPVPVIEHHTEAEDLSIATRDVLVLDGSESTGDVVNWTWAVIDGNGTLAPDWSYPNLTTLSLFGKTVYFEPPSDGPFNVTLTVTDSTGMTGVSNSMIIPPDPQFDPPVAMKVDLTLFPPVINVTVQDSYGKPVPDIPVSFYPFSNPYGNLSFTPWSGITDINGNVSTNATGVGTIQIVSGKLPPAYVSVPG